MLITEFEALTGFYPDIALWDEINRVYENSKLDKHEWCKAYTENREGMANVIARLTDKKAYRWGDGLEEELRKANTEISLLRGKLEDVRAQLDRELDWQPAKDIGTNMSEKEYAELADDEPPLSDLEAIRRVHKECGFDMAYIRIVTTVRTFDKSKHGKCRVSGEYSRSPVWSSSDWNYIRFDVADMQWEIVNGELMPYYD